MIFNGDVEELAKRITEITLENEPHWAQVLPLVHFSTMLAEALIDSE